LGEPLRRIYTCSYGPLVHRFSIPGTLNGGEYRSRFTLSGGLHPGNGFSRVSPRTAPAPVGAGWGDEGECSAGDGAKAISGLLIWNRSTRDVEGLIFGPYRGRQQISSPSPADCTWRLCSLQ
jgi:hypothetical protein